MLSETTLCGGKAQRVNEVQQPIMAGKTSMEVPFLPEGNLSVWRCINGVEGRTAGK